MPAVDPRLKEAYTTRDGVAFYEFQNDGLMAYKRFATANLADRFLRLGFTESFLDRVIETGIELAMDSTRPPAQLRQDMVAIFQNLKMRKGYMCGEEQYLRMAAVYFVLADEPLEECYESWTQKKLAIWEADTEAKNFFLQRAISKTHGLLPMSEDDMRELFKMAKERESNISTLPKVSPSG